MIKWLKDIGTRVIRFAKALDTFGNFDLLLAWVIAILLRVLFLATRGLAKDTAFFSDDALITLRYALNLAQGHGFVYNVGENVLGTTTPLYTLLLTIPAILNLDLLWSSVIFNLFVDCVSILVIHQVWKPQVKSSWGRFLLLMLFAANPVIIFWSCYGMEVSLFILLALLSTWFFWIERYWVAGLFAALVLLTRLDGIVFLGSLGLTHLLFSFSSRKRLWMPWKSAIAFGLAVTPWSVFSVVNFGSVVSNSILAKQIAYGWIQIPLTSIFNFGLGFGILPLFVVGCYILMHNYSRSGRNDFACQWGMTHFIWAAALLIFFAATRAPAHIYEWYRVPFFAATALVGMIGMPALGERLKQSWVQNNRMGKHFSLYAIVLSFAPLLVFYGRPIVSMAFKPQEEYTTSMHLAVGRWLRNNVAAGATVMAGNIGYIGYFSQLRILDDVGLVPPEALPVLLKNNGNPSPLIAIFRPDYLALENRERLDMQAEIDHQGCVQVFEIDVSLPTHQSPYRVFRCPWAD